VQAAGGASAPHHCYDDVPRDGHAVLAGAGGGGLNGTRMRWARGYSITRIRSQQQRPPDCEPEGVGRSSG
jgi:hypothetical protein